MVKARELIDQLRAIGIKAELNVDKSSSYWICVLWSEKKSVGAKAAGTTAYSSIFAAMIELIKLL